MYKLNDNNKNIKLISNNNKDKRNANAIRRRFCFKEAKKNNKKNNLLILIAAAVTAN